VNRRSFFQRVSAAVVGVVAFKSGWFKPTALPKIPRRTFTRSIFPPPPPEAFLPPVNPIVGVVTASELDLPSGDYRIRVVDEWMSRHIYVFSAAEPIDIGTLVRFNMSTGLVEPVR